MIERTCIGCNRPSERMKYAGGYYLCGLCWTELMTPGQDDWTWSKYRLPSEIARRVLNAEVISRCDAEQAWERKRHLIHGSALTDGIATFFPVVWFLYACWICYECATDGKPLHAWGLLGLGFWLGSCAVHLFYKRDKAS